MNEVAKWQKIALWALPVLVLCGLALKSPGYFADPRYLGAFIFLEIVLASLWQYRVLYFPLTMFFFIWAGLDIPLKGPAQSARWVVLGVGAVVGIAIWIRERRQSLGALHLFALLCLPTAAVSATESGDRTAALLKVSSLSLLFVYAATGARVGIQGREIQFIRGLLRSCELILYMTALAYAAGWEIWGNPNSLGAVTGVVVVPLLLWGFMIAETRREKYRMAFAFLVGFVLLYVSLSRASILAATTSCIMLCLCLRQQRLLARGIFVAVLLLAGAAVLQPDRFAQLTANLKSDLLYKGHAEKGVLASRQRPWDATVASLKQHPWFGTGFGTSDPNDERKGGEVASITAFKGIRTRSGTNREHGNSYLALAEYVGILGLLPFSVLLFLVGRMVVRMCLWMRQTADPRHCAVPLSIVLLAGFVHAFFEDWLVAVGYYLCAFFWVMAFLLYDLMPERRVLVSSPAYAPIPTKP